MPHDPNNSFCLMNRKDLFDYPCTCTPPVMRILTGEQVQIRNIICLLKILVDKTCGCGHGGCGCDSCRAIDLVEELAKALEK